MTGQSVFEKDKAIETTSQGNTYDMAITDPSRSNLYKSVASVLSVFQKTKPAQPAPNAFQYDTLQTATYHPFLAESS